MAGDQRGGPSYGRGQTLAAPCEAIGDPADGLVVMSTLLHCLWRLSLMCSLRTAAPLGAVGRSPGIPCMD